MAVDVGRYAAAAALVVVLLVAEAAGDLLVRALLPLHASDTDCNATQTQSLPLQTPDG